MSMCDGSDKVEKAVRKAKKSPEIEAICAICPCPEFARHTDPFAADYEITNCAGLSARLQGKWGNLRKGRTGIIPDSITGKVITVSFTVEGMHELAGRSLINRGSDFTSPAPGNPCDIIFVLWVLRPGKWGLRLADKNGLEVYRGPPETREDFHIVAGRLDNQGNVPATVYSTNGSRPLEGPKPIGDWAQITGTPSTTYPDNKQRFILSSAVSAPGSAPYGFTDIPLGSVDNLGSALDPHETYYRVERFNDDPTPEVFIIEYEFMERFISSP